MSQELERLYQKGKKLQQEGKWDEVITVCTEILGLEKNDEKKALVYAVRGGAYDKKGSYYQNKGDDDQAIENYDHSIDNYGNAINLNPQAEAFNNRGIAYGKKGDCYQKKDDYDQAIENYDHSIDNYGNAINLNPDYAFAYSNLGMIYVQKEEYENAFKNFIKANNNDKKLRRKQPFVYIAFVINESISDEEKTTKISMFTYYAKLLSTIEDLQERLFYRGGSYEVAHYTSLDVLKSVAEDKACFRLYNASYMNDPEEGCVFFEIMKDTKVMGEHKIDIEEIFYGDSSKKPQISPAYIGSFVKVDSESKEKEDGKLFLWRTYGKHDNKEAAGTCLIFDDGKFAKELPLMKLGHMDQVDMPLSRSRDSAPDIPAAHPLKKEKDQTPQLSLYVVKYEGDVKDDGDKCLQKLFAELGDSLNKIEAFRKRAEKKGVNIKKEFAELIRELLDSIRFLFKAERYKEEKEVRVVLMSYQTDPRRKADTEQLPPRFYIEAPGNFRFSKVILGPQAGGLHRWEWWLQSKNENLEVTKSKIPFGENYQ